jgi:AcrR family transcriptional regulator
MQPAERRELIRQQGARLFGRDGYAATRLDDVAAAAGVTKPMVYRHFGSKKELYLAILRRHEADLPTFIERVDKKGTTPDALVAAILGGWLDYVAENSDAWLVIFRDRTGDSEIEKARRHVNQRATEVLAEFVRASAPGLDRELVEPTANFLTSGLAGLVLWWIDHPQVSRETVHATATRACAAVLGR